MVEKQPYRVLEKLGEHAELRSYPAHRVVSVEVSADLEDAGTLGFGPLVGYISGGNAAGQRIAMTSPVLLQPRDDHRHVVSFVLPEAWWYSDAPRPLADRVWVEDRPAGTLAAIRFRGWWRKDKAAEQLDALRGMLRARGIEPTGGPLFARYDPPSVPGFLRRNEVLIPI